METRRFKGRKPEGERNRHAASPMREEEKEQGNTYTGNGERATGREFE